AAREDDVNLLTTLGTRFRTADTRHLAILKGMMAVALFTSVGKLMSAAKEMAVAFRYGRAAEVDAYQFLYNLISWPVGIWCSVLTAGLGRLAARMREQQADELPRFRSELFGLAVMLGLGLGMAAWAGVWALLAHGRSGLPAYSAQLALAALPGLVLLLSLG